MYYQDQVKMKHWQTMSFSEHKALDSLHSTINDLKDDIVEKLIGYTGKRPTNIVIESLKDNLDSIMLMNDMFNFASELCNFGEINHFQDISNLADTLSGEIAKTKYLLTLS